MRRRLEMQADRIEAVLASHKVPGRVWGGTITPRFIRFQLTTSLGTRVNKVSQLSEEFALSLGVSSARIYRQNGAIQVEVPRSKPQSVRLLPLCQRLSNVPPLAALLGLDHDGTPLLLRLPSPDVVHVLISGTTGSGKTALLRSILLSLAMFNRQGALQLLLIDPKSRGFSPLAQLPHILGRLVSTPQEGVQALSWLIQEMERRDRDHICSPSIVVAIDELADLLTTGGKEVETALLRLAQRGREAGIHLLCATQKPAASILSSLIKANFPVRLVGSVSSPEDAKVASGIAATGAEKLLGRGDFLLINKGQIVRFQAAYAPEVDIRQIVNRLHLASDSRHRWSQSVPLLAPVAQPVPGSTS
ncbi:MAG: DNA translocase FtsK [Chloroflexota bacterium]|nr:DNA translocase FtsK [Chloroflexota bacterium]